MDSVKLFEVRDCGTLIPVLAMRLEPSTEAERWLLERGGFGSDKYDQRTYVGVCKVNGSTSQWTTDTCEWAGADRRTMRAAHRFIEQHFDELETGTVVDVEFLLGETDTPKVSERVGEGNTHANALIKEVCALMKG